METKLITPNKTLRQHVAELLKAGKRSHDEEFQVMFRVFGEERIRAMAKEILAEMKNSTPTPAVST